MREENMKRRKLIYSWCSHRYLFHYICEDGITYMCMADDSFGRRVPFAFLQDLKDKFLSTYGKDRALHSPPYGLNEFSRTIAKQMVTQKVQSQLELVLKNFDVN